MISSIYFLTFSSLFSKKRTLYFSIEMGGTGSINCGCFAVISSACKGVSSYLHPKPSYEKLSILEEDNIYPAGLLSDQEIQKLLNESLDIYGSCKDAKTSQELPKIEECTTNFDNSY
ncbi:unnamed protein product [Blepharisma stoltei]|uniref:Uncharacterized protein n=1 Tax=Blepharisma stoltei TaxID=1481888 RepID=A0AAU9I9M2_9CILI|nr:unnamed protein product [Blepharisma stoltei]